MIDRDACLVARGMRIALKLKTWCGDGGELARAYLAVMAERDALDKEVDLYRWLSIHALAERDDALWEIERMYEAADYALRGEDTEDQQTLRWVVHEAGRALAGFLSGEA